MPYWLNLSQNLRQHADNNVNYNEKKFFEIWNRCQIYKKIFFTVSATK
jgi:hypothetical protein